MAGYNRTRYVEDLLQRTEAFPPSFTIHLHPEHWTLNKGPKFLYNNPIASLLDDIREHRIPVDFLELFDSARVAFYDGCMVVELLDYRPQKNKEPSLEKPERTRTILHPNSETIWADICSLNQKLGGKWTDKDAFEIEARILLATSPPICLDPDPHLTRMANHVMRVSTPTVPLSLKRKAVALEPEEDETDKARRAKIMQFMNPRPDRITPSYRILDALQRQQAKNGQAPTPPSTQPPVHQQPPPQLSASNSNQEQPPVDVDDTKPKPKKKPDTPQQPYATTTFARANGSQTPAPSQTHHFVNQHPHNSAVHTSPSPSTHSPMQPQVYANLQAATEAAAKRTPTPQYAHSPRPPSQPQPISQPSPHPQTPVQQPPSLPTFQPPVMNAQFLHAPPPGTRPGVAKNSPIASHLVPRQLTPTPPTHLQLYAQHMQQQQQQLQQQNLLQQRLVNSKSGRSTPQGPPAQSTTSPARSSPLVSNQRLASRSPMPPSSQQIPPQMPQHPQQINYPPQYNPLMRPIHGNSSPRPQALPPHMANGSAAQNSPSPHPPPTADGQTQPQPQPQPQPHPPPHHYPQMYGYPQVNFAMQPGRLPPGYWPVGPGRGVPGMVNGQPMPGMVPNGQQLPLGMGKAVPGGMPGR